MYEETKPTNTGAEDQPADAPKQLLVDMGSTVVRNSRGTIHCLTIIGQIEGHCTAPQTYQYFTRLQESIVRFVARSSRISEEKFRELMLHGNDMASDVGTVVYGEEAVQLGLIDRVGQLKDAYEALYAML